jgi:hypothetical protein
MLKPKVYAVYTDPIKGTPGKKASLKVLNKIVKDVGVDTLRCEWIKKIKLYSGKDFKAAQKLGMNAPTWLGDADNQSALAIDLHLSSKEAADQVVYGASLPAPEILTVAESAGADASVILTIEGNWFGTKNTPFPPRARPSSSKSTRCSAPPIRRWWTARASSPT